MGEGRLPANEHRILTPAEPRMRVEPQSAPVQEPIIKEYPFTGSWLPSPDPFVIGEKNYAMLQNLRYREGELQSVLGYSRLTGTPHATYPKGRNGIQFYKTIGGQPLSILLVQAYTPDLSSSAVLVHAAAPPLPADFTPGPLHIDAVGAQGGRFALAPDQNVAYCNGRESMIWGGEESRVAAFMVTDADFIPLRDYTEPVRTISQEPGSTAQIHTGITQPTILLGTTRPASSFKFYVLVPNTVIGTITAFYWGSSGWTAVTGGFNGTEVGGIPFAQTGTVAWADAPSTARPAWFFDRVLYWYKIQFSNVTSSGTSVSYATVHMPWQPVKDLWDGIERKLIYLELVQGGAHKDYTLEALEAEAVSTTTATGPSPSTTASGVVVPLGGLTSGNYLVAGFSQPMMGIRFKMGLRPQGNASTFTIQFWDGNGWATPNNLTDDTQSLGKTGVISWTQPDPGVEFSQTYAGLSGYFYKVIWSATLSTEVDLDQVQGIAAPRRLGGFAFPFKFQNRLLLCGDLQGNQGYKAEFSLPNAPEVWNGEDSSAEGKELFFGEGGTLTAATEIYNRYAGSLAYLGVFCKATETWILTGNNPESFTIFPVSRTIGCPAPLTMTSAEVAYSVSEDAQRNIALWLSEHGPVAFDGSVIVSIPGVECYFDQNDPRAINMNAIGNARGWYDHQTKEWNLCIPSGAGQVTNNAWLVYDLRRQKWLEKTPPNYPQGAFTVQDLAGRNYGYGLFDTGHLMRLESGFTWDGTPIHQVLETAELLPVNSTFEETLLRYLRVTTKRGLGSHTGMPIIHYANGELTGPIIATVGPNDGNKRLADVLHSCNRVAQSHRLRFEVITTDQQLTWLSFSMWFYRVRRGGR